MRIGPPVHPCFVNLLRTELLNGFLLHISCTIILQFIIHEIFGGGYRLFLPVRLKALQRGVQYHYVHYTEA